MERGINIPGVLLGNDIEAAIVSLLFALVGLFALWSIVRLVARGTDVTLASCRRWGRTSAVAAVLALAATRTEGAVSLDIGLLLALAALDCWLVTTFAHIKTLPRAKLLQAGKACPINASARH